MKRIKDSFFARFSMSLTVENMCQRIQWLVFLRWMAGISVIILLLAGKAFYETESIMLPLMLGVGILIYNSVFDIIRRKQGQHKKNSEQGIHARILIINLQILIDLVVLAVLIYVTGGITNPFLFFFVFHMVISSIFLSRRNAFFWALFTIVMEGILFFLEHFGYIVSHKFFPFYPEGLIDNGMHVLLLWSVFTVTMVITVYFATSIMKPIRKRQLDLTELQESLQMQRDKLEQKNKELSELDHSKTEFLYRVEHELKAPIGALQGLISVVSRGYNTVDDAKKLEFLDRAEKRAGMMKELVTDLLSLSKINERNFQLELETVDLVELVMDVVNDLGFYAEKKNISIRCDLESSLPTIQADKHAMLDIVRNLIHNGVKYSFQGEVRVTLFRDDDHLVFRVADNGIGISEDDLKNIFADFYRTANAKAFEEGTGLGLSLVKRLVERHGGTIAAASELNKGTTFTVTIPLEHRYEEADGNNI